MKELDKVYCVFLTTILSIVLEMKPLAIEC
jgi:hypothetical protein